MTVCLLSLVVALHLCRVRVWGETCREILSYYKTFQSLVDSGIFKNTQQNLEFFFSYLLIALHISHTLQTSSRYIDQLFRALKLSISSFVCYKARVDLVSISVGIRESYLKHNQCIPSNINRRWPHLCWSLPRMYCDWIAMLRAYLRISAFQTNK